MKWNERRKVLQEIKSFIKELDLNQDEVCFTGSTIIGMPDAMEVLAREDYRLAVVVLSSPKVVDTEGDPLSNVRRRLAALEDYVAERIEARETRMKEFSESIHNLAEKTVGKEGESQEPIFVAVRKKKEKESK